jgi:hypothetical protein
MRRIASGKLLKYVNIKTTTDGAVVGACVPFWICILEGLNLTGGEN